MSDILILDHNGQPNSLVKWKTAVCYEAKDMVKWSLGKISIIAHGGKSRMTGEQSVIELPSIIAISDHHNKKYKVPPLTNSNLWRRDNNICCYCNRYFRDDKLTRDHIVPTSKGGEDTWLNVVAACKPCNGFKADFLLSEIDMVMFYVPYIPDRNEMIILKNKGINAEQLEFIKNFLPGHSRAHNIRAYKD